LQSYHVQIKFPYVSYIEEAYGVRIDTLLDSISAATGGKFTFSVDDSFDLKDIKDFGRGNCLQALNQVIEAYGCEIDPDNFNIHISKQIGKNRKNLININFKDSSRALVTRMFSQMKDGRTFIGLPASHLTEEEYALLDAVPGAIVNGVIRVNYLISPHVGYWSNTTNTYYDGEVINQDIEDPLELLEFTRKSLRESEVPSIDIDLSLVDLHLHDYVEPEAFLGDTIKLHDAEMQIKGITARIMELREPLFDPSKQPDFTIANYFLTDYEDIIADLNRSKDIVNNIISGGKVRADAFEKFAAAAVKDINNSKSEVIYDVRGIVLRSKDNHDDQVVIASKGLYVTQDGGKTAAAALTAAGLVAEKVYGKLGNFIEIEIGLLNNVFKANSSGIHLGHQQFSSSPFRVNMAGQLVANSANITGTIHATGGTFSGGIVATGTITGGTIYGARIATSSNYPRSEMSTNGNLFGAYSSADSFTVITPVNNISSTPAIWSKRGSAEFILGHEAATMGGMGLWCNSDFEIWARNGFYVNDLRIPSWNNIRLINSQQTSLAQELDQKANKFTGLNGTLYMATSSGGSPTWPVKFVNGIAT